MQILVLVVALLVACKLIVKYVLTNRCACKTKLDGRVALITGATSGIGKATALDLSRRGAMVILGCRNVDKAESVKLEIVSRTGNPNVLVQKLELSDMSSVRRAVASIEERIDHLDILVNNAAMIGGEKVVTKDGFESYFAASHFGPFLLTNLLLPLLKRSAPSRIVNVSSSVHKYGNIDFANLHCEKGFNGWDVYAKSKLANVLFTAELSRRLDGSGVTVNCLHPGFILTNIFSSMPRVMYYPFVLLACWFSKSTDDGCQTTVHCAVAPGLRDVTGQYFANCNLSRASGQQAHDAQVASKLWEVSERLTNL